MNRARIRIVSYLTAAFLVAIGFGVQGQSQARAYQQELSNAYHHAFSELTTAAGELNTALEKSLYTTTPHMLGTLCTQIYAKALAAQFALGELPYSNVELEQTAAFFAKTGDYALAMSRTGEACGEEEQAALRGLSECANSLTQALYSIQSDLSAGSISLEDVAAAQDRLARAQETASQITGGSVFQNIESDFPEIPTLVYDGPFSQHLSSREPLALSGLPQVSQDEARAAAAAFLGLKPELFTLVSAGAGALPTYSFSAAVDGGEVYLEVTRQGGQILSFFNSRPVSESTVTNEQAVLLAQNYLASWGYPAMRESYYVSRGNILTIHFASVSGDVLCYPDLVKVSIALDTGRLIGFEAHGYLMNHADRDLPAPVITSEEALRIVSPNLTVLSTQLALIPSAGEYETLCHEFKCQTDDGRHVLIYVNAETGQEEQILLLIEDESGTLAL